MRTRAELKPVVRGGVIGLGLGKFTFVGGGVALMLAANCMAGPENPRVAAGRATFNQRGNTTIIRASDRSIIDYSGFDIARGETVRFIQPGASATVLNRIHSERPTTIDGTLRANGRVFLLNPNGIAFSGTSVVNTNGLVAAAGMMSNSDFLSGVERITDIQGDVSNAGRIVSGSAALIGRHVENTGSVISGAENGVVAMIASNGEVTLTPRDGNMSIKVSPSRQNPTAPQPGRAGVDNRGTLSAKRGRATLMAGDIYSLAVKNTGTVQARNVGIAAKAGEVRVSGTVDAGNNDARVRAGRAGTIDITGGSVVVENADISADGVGGGGRVRVGGDFQGQSRLAASESTSVDASSTISADAVSRGRGGEVVVNSGGHTDLHGTVSARGGTAAGDGGFIETSGKSTIDLDGSLIDAGVSARGAKAGSWLVDPTDFTVNAGNVGTFNTALDMGMNVTIETGSGGADAGNVTVDAAITKSAGGDATLTIRAENNIVVNQAITSSAGQLNVDAQANTAGNGNVDADTTAGDFTVNNDGATTFGAINTNGGTLSVAAVDVALIGAGATVTANGGVTFVANSSADQSIGLGGGTGNFDLTSGEMAQISSTGTVSLTQASNQDAVDIDTLALGTTAYDLSVSGGPMTVDNIALSAGSTLTLIADNATTDAAITGNGVISVSGGTINLEADDVQLGGGTMIDAGAAGTVNLRAKAGNDVGLGAAVADAFVLTDAELDNITAGTIEIRTLGGAGDDVTVGAIDPANAANLAIRTAGRIEESAVDNTTKITLLAGGRLTLEAGEGVGDPGTNDGTGAGPLDISAAELDAVVAGTGGLFIKNTGDLVVVDATTADGKVSIRTTGAMSVQNVDATEAAASGRTLELVSGDALTATGPVSANGSAYFQTTNAGQDISIANADVAPAGFAVILATTGAGADAAITNAGGVALLDVNVGGNLAVTATTGDITDSSTVTVGGDAAFTTSAADADINLGTLAVTGTVGANTTGAGGNATLASTGAVTLGASSIGGDLSVTAGGNITDGGAVAVGGAADLQTTAANDDITLDSTTVVGAISLNTTGAGGNASVTSTAPVELGLSSVGGTLSVDSEGAITQSGAVVVDGAASFKTRSNAGAAITLEDTDNRFGALTAQARDMADAAPAAGNISITETGAGGNVMDVALIQTAGSARLVAAVLDIDTGSPGSAITAGADGISLEPLDPTSGIGVGAGAPGAFQISTLELQELATPGTVTIGRANGTGLVTVGNASDINLSATTYDLTLRGGAITFNRTLTLSDDSLATLRTISGGAGGSVTSTLGLATPAIVVGGTTGQLLIDAVGAVDFSASVDQFAARTTGAASDIDYRNIGSALEIATLGGVAGVSAAGGDITIRSGDSITVSSGIVNTGNGGVSLNVTTMGDIIDNTGAMGTAVTVGSNGSIGLDAVTGRVGGAGATDPFKISTGAASGGNTASIVADADGGVRLLNSGDGPVEAAIGSSGGIASLSSAGPISTSAAWNADSIEIISTGASGSGLVTIAHDLTADGGGTATDGDITISGNDLVIQGSTAIMAGAGMGDVIISRSTAGGINVGGGTFGAVSGITDYLAVDNTELGQITAATLTIGDNDQTQFIRVQDVTTPANIDRVILRAERDDAAIRFGGTMTSSFKALEARADAGIEVARDITATEGSLVLDADADMADDTPGAFFTTDADVLTFTGNRTLTTSGMPADSPDISLSGRRAMGETGISADADLTLNSANDVFINQNIDVVDTLNLDADGEVQLSGGGNGRELDISANSGIRFTGNITIGAGGLSVDADADDDDSGTFSLLSGTLTINDTASLNITAADVEILGSIVAGTGAGAGDVRISRSNPGDIQVGDFVDNNGSNDLLTIDNDELARITAGRLVVGNFDDAGGMNINTNNIVVDGVTTMATTNIGEVRLDAGMNLTFSGGESRFRGLDGRAQDDITVSTDVIGNHDMPSSDPRTVRLAADSDVDGSGSLIISNDVQTRGGAFIGRGADLALTGSINTAADGGTGATRGDVTLSRIDGNITVNNVADDASRMTINDAELALITAGNLNIGEDIMGGDHTNRVTVRGFTAADGMGINGTTAFFARERISFSGAASAFGALNAQSGGGIDIGTNLTTTSGDLVLNGNSGTGADGSIDFLTGNRVLDSAGNILLNTAGGTGEIVSDGNLTLRADGDVDINGAFRASTPLATITIGADRDADGSGTFILHNGQAFSAQNAIVNITAADLNLGTIGNGDIFNENGTITIERSTLGRIALGGATAGPGDMRIDNTELARLSASDISIGGANTSRLDARTVTALDRSSITGAVTLSALGNQNGQNNGVVRFRGGVSRFQELVVNSRANIRVDDAASVVTSARGILFDAASGTASLSDGRIDLGGNLSTPTSGTSGDRNLTLNGRVFLTRNVTLSAGRNITLNGRVDTAAAEGNNRDLTLNAGGANFIRGDIGRQRPVRTFQTNSAGRTELGASIFAADGSGIRFRDRVILNADVTVQDDGTRGVFFHDSINDDIAPAGRTLTVIARRSASATPATPSNLTIPVIAFGNNVGASRPLGGLNLNFGTDRNGNPVDGRTTPSLVSTIIARGIVTDSAGDGQFATGVPDPTAFVFNVAGDFVMGQGEKFSSAGALELNVDGTARLGDVLAFGDLTVDSPDIRIRTRPAGMIADPVRVGNTIIVNTRSDLGVDIVADGEVNFTSRPTVEGTGPVPTFGNSSGVRGSNLDGFIFRKFAAGSARINSEAFEFVPGNNPNLPVSTTNPANNAGIVNLDLTSDGPTDTNFADSIAGFIPREGRFNDVAQESTVSRALFNDLEQLGVNPRNLSGDEIQANLAGFSTYNDFPLSLSAEDAVYQTAVNRLPDARTRAVVEQWRSLFSKSEVNPETGEVIQRPQVAIIRRAFTEAVARYRKVRNVPDDFIDPIALREYVDSTPEEADAKAYADQLHDLLSNLRLLGLVGRELAQSKRSLLTNVKPSGKVFRGTGLADLERFISAGRPDPTLAEPEFEMPADQVQ